MPGDLRGAVVSDVRHQRRHTDQRMRGHRLHTRGIHLDALDAVRPEARHGVGQQAQAVLQVAGDQRLVDVELELPLARGDADRHVVPHHLRAHHRQCLDLRGVDLARHHRTAGFIGGQPQFAQAGARPAAHQADVIGDLVERHGKHPERAMQPHQGFMAGHRGEQVVGHDEGRIQPGGQHPGHARAELGVGVEPRAHRRATEGQRMDIGQRAPDRRVGQRELRRVGAELLPEGDRRGVLQVGAAHLEHARERLGLGQQRGAQIRQRSQQRTCRQHRSDVNRRRKHVVRRLPQVHIVVRVHAAIGTQPPAQRDGRQIGDDLVDVHVALRARSGLPHRQRELVFHLAGGDARRGRGHRLGLRGVQQAEIAVDLGRGALDLRQRMHDRRGHALRADGEEAQAAFGLRAPQGIARHLDGAEAVCFAARRGRHRHVLAAGVHFGRGHFSCLSGWLSCPARSSFTACTTARATLRVSLCTAVSWSSASWLL